MISRWLHRENDEKAIFGKVIEVGSILKRRDDFKMRRKGEEDELVFEKKLFPF